MKTTIGEVYDKIVDINSTMCYLTSMCDRVVDEHDEDAVDKALSLLCSYRDHLMSTKIDI